jgi:hypothetical protein
MDATTTSLLVAGIVATGPTLLAIINGREARAARHEDWARQDVVAAELARRQDATEHRATVAAHRTAEELAKVVAQGEAIHSLVNSNLTEAKAEALDWAERNAALMREMFALLRAGGREPTPEALAVLDATAQRVASLRAEMTDRTATSARLD